VKVSQLAIHAMPAICALALTAGVQAADAPTPSNPVATEHRHVTPPPRPTVVTEIEPGIPGSVRETTEQGKGRARGFDTRRHRLPSGEYIRK
jgi:hypothetical protein